MNSKLKIQRVSEEVEHPDNLETVGGNRKGSRTLQKQCGSFLEI